MFFAETAAMAVLLAGWGGISLDYSVGMMVLSFFVFFCTLALGSFSLTGHALVRSLGIASFAIAGLTCVLTRLTAFRFALTFLIADVILIALAFAFLVIVCGRVDLEEPQAEEDSPFYRKVMDIYIAALMDLVGVRLHTKGLEKTPKEGRFLVVCNHLFLADPGIVLNAFRKSQLAFITKQENRTMPIINKFMHKILCQYLDRDDDRQALRVILKCIQLIKEDKVSVCVFPEGYTSKDGKLHHFRNGVFKIAQKANVPIVVCTIQNTRSIFPNLKKLRRTDVEFHLVDVIPAEELKGKTTADIGNRVYELMISDLGENFRMEEPQNT